MQQSRGETADGEKQGKPSIQLTLPREVKEESSAEESSSDSEVSNFSIVSLMCSVLLIPPPLFPLDGDGADCSREY